MKLPAIASSLLLKPAAVVAGWKAFWFTPADPTVLGMIRIGTGFVLLYILIVSTPLLPVLYAPDGWVDLRTTDLFRHEMPWTLPRPDWDPPPEMEPTPPPMLRPELARGAEAKAYSLRWNINPAFTYDMGQDVFSQWFHITDPRWMLMVHGLAIFVAVLFTLGVGTRVVSVLAWVLAMGYIHRAQAALFGMDTMLALLLLYLMLAPAGAALSVDRLIQRFRVSLGALSKHQPIPLLTPRPSVAANVVLRLLQVHFCMIYLASGASKLQGAAWWNGTAVWQTVSNYEFAPVHFAFFTTLLRWSAADRWVWETINFIGGSAFTLALELGLPFLIWYPRWRWLMITGAVMLHTGIALMMGLTAFSLLMMLILLSFVPTAAVKGLIERLFHGKAQLWLLFNSRPKVGVRLASLIHAFDAWRQVTLVDVSLSQRQHEDEPDWLPIPGQLTRPQLVAEPEQVLSGYPMIERLLRSLRILWPVALLTWLPGVHRLGRAIAPGEQGAAMREEVSGGVS
jgi:hypothetical protein